MGTGDKMEGLAIKTAVLIIPDARWKRIKIPPQKSKKLSLKKVKNYPRKKSYKIARPYNSIQRIRGHRPRVKKTAPTGLKDPPPPDRKYSGN